MGSFGSREVTVQTRDVALPLTKLFVNFVSFGFMLGLLIHEHEITIWGTYFDRFSFIRYGKGIYFIWFVLTWYIVYVGIYVLILGAMVRPFLFSLVGYRRELQCELLLEILFGLWVCGQVLGSWLDWQKDTDCLKTANCQSYFMQQLLNCMEWVCEYFAAYDYDPVHQAYYLRKDNMCYNFFHAVPAFLMTLLSTSLAYLMLMIIR